MSLHRAAIAIFTFLCLSTAESQLPVANLTASTFGSRGSNLLIPPQTGTSSNSTSGQLGEPPAVFRVPGSNPPMFLNNAPPYPIHALDLTQLSRPVVYGLQEIALWMGESGAGFIGLPGISFGTPGYEVVHVQPGALNSMGTTQAAAAIYGLWEVVLNYGAQTMRFSISVVDRGTTHFVGFIEVTVGQEATAVINNGSASEDGGVATA